MNSRDLHFWVTNLIRGLLALAVGSGAIVIPDLAATLLFLPFAVIISALCLSVYAILDSALVFISSFMLPSKTEAFTLRVQGILGVSFGVALLSLVYDKVHLHWFLYMIAAQAFFTAIVECIIARHAHTRGASIWNYAASIAALAFAIGYSCVAVTAETEREPREIAWLIFGYLLSFGLAQCITAARELFSKQSTAEASV
ncbi:MAG: hypothetical protein JWM43_3315 [Acidobacteriaceae bacterium]|nr:hypothetical protein [Acidobacteriaceae bacterium]